MSRIKINKKVISVETGKVGVVRARNVIHENKSTNVEYLVDFGGSMKDWKVMHKNQLKKIVSPEQKLNETIIVRDLPSNMKLTMYAVVSNKKYCYDDPAIWDFWTRKGKRLDIGYSIYNGVDEYDEKIGVKFAKHRAKHKPFCYMESPFSGEFNQMTVEAILDAKVAYIKEHIDEFCRKEA